MASGIWDDLDDASCAMTLPTFECATNKQQRFNKKQKNKKKSAPSEKALARKLEKKTREKAIAGNRDRRESNMHPYEQSSHTYIKTKGKRKERLEDEFSDKNIMLHQGKEWLAPYGPHKEGVIPRHAYEISMWYKSLMKPPPVPVKRFHRVYYDSEVVLLTQSLKSIELHGKRVSWADDNKQKLVSLVKYIPARKPANCYLASRACFMRTYCFCESK